MISDPTIYDTLTSEGKIGIHIFLAREKQGMSRKALAAKTGLSVNVIIAIEDLFKERMRKSSKQMISDLSEM